LRVESAAGSSLRGVQNWWEIVIGILTSYETGFESWFKNWL